MPVTMQAHDVPDDPLRAAAALGPTIAAAALDVERAGRVPTDLLEELRTIGLFRMGLPQRVGGSATPYPTMLAAFEEIARHDGSTGWVAMIGSGTNVILTGLPDDSVDELFGPDPDIVTGGT